MAISSISSNTVTAQSSISELTGVDASSFTNQQVDITTSNITAMQTGQEINNQLMDDISSFVSAILIQAKKFPSLAAAFEDRDAQDAQSW